MFSYKTELSLVLKILYFAQVVSGQRLGAFPWRSETGQKTRLSALIASVQCGPEGKMDQAVRQQKGRKNNCLYVFTDGMILNVGKSKEYTHKYWNSQMS